jgi:ribosomal protein L37AE/L43A
MTYRSTSPKVCPDCGSLAIIRLEDLDTCQRCGAKRKRMQALHAQNNTVRRPQPLVSEPRKSSVE